MKNRAKKRIAAACAVAALLSLCLLMAFGALDMGPMSEVFGAGAQIQPRRPHAERIPGG